MAEPLKTESRIYTYSDYIKWPEDERLEWINGLPHAMTPAPSRVHQKIAVPKLLCSFRIIWLGKLVGLWSAF